MDLLQRLKNENKISKEKFAHEERSISSMAFGASIFFFQQIYKTVVSEKKGVAR